jgi:hypothetical protein
MEWCRSTTMAMAAHSIAVREFARLYSVNPDELVCPIAFNPLQFS